MTRNPVRILIADDHELARLGLESVLSTADWLEVVGGVGDCSSALEAVRREPPVLAFRVRRAEAQQVHAVVARHEAAHALRRRRIVRRR